MRDDRFAAYLAGLVCVCAGFAADAVVPPTNPSAARAVSRPPAEPAVRTITDDGGRYCGWPTVTRLRSGEIVATYSGGRDGHICPWGKVRAVRSKDGGETWTKPETLVDGPLDDRDAALLELDNGDLVLFYFTSVAFALDAGFKKTREYQSHPEYARRFAELPADLVRAELGSFSMRRGRQTDLPLPGPSAGLGAARRHSTQGRAADRRREPVCGGAGAVAVRSG